MNEKVFEAKINFEETPNPNSFADKPSLSNKFSNKRVDINVLKARAKAIQDKENIKNTIIVIFFVLAFGATGIYLSI